MDTVWVDTMFPGIDEEAGWKENLERVVNYDYLLKEYLDWQLKHLTTDNFDPTDWANVTADIIKMAAGSVDLTAYYDKDEVDAKAQLILDTADDHADAKLLSYYTKDEADAQAALTLGTAEGYTNAALQSYYTAAQTDSAISTQAGLTLTAAEGYTDTQLASYYTASQVDGAISAQAVLSQQAAETYTNTQLQSYYTASAVDGMFSTADTALKAYADAAVANIDLTAYYTKTEIGDFTGYQTAVAALKAYADAAVASIDLSAYYTATDVDGMFTTSEASVKGYADGLISGLSLAATGSGSSAKLVLQSGGSTIANSGASMALSVTNSNGYSTLALTAGGITLATSNQINLGGDVIFSSTNIGSSSYRNSNIRSGVASIIDGVVTANYVNALGITADSIVANASISSPTITGATIRSSTFYAGTSNSNYCVMESGGFAVYTGGSIRAWLYQDSNIVGLRLGDTTPYAYVQKYYSGGTHYMWIGNSTRSAGLLVNLSAGTCSLVGAA